MRIRMTIAGTLILLGLAATIGVAPAQEREPPPQLPMMCPAVGGVAGGQEDERGQVVVDLPRGTFYRLLIPPETIYFGYCHVETGAQVTLSITDCLEGSRLAPTAEGQRIVDQIVASCRMSDKPPEPHCPAGTAVTGPGPFTVEPDVRVTLPSGTFFVSHDPRQPRTVTVCAVQDNGLSMRYATVLSLNDCSQLGRTHIDGEDFVEADAIAASCVVVRDTSGDLPTPAPRGTPVPSGRSGITPPDTGSAGLPR